MAPWRSSRAARPPATSTQGPRTPATHSIVWLPALLLTLGGCSSAGDSYLGEAPSSSTADSGLSGPDSSASASAGADESSGEQDGATDPSGVGDSGGGSTGGETGAPPEAPQGEPTPEDLVEAKAVEAEACDLATPVSLTLRTLDAAATVSPALARDAALSEWVSLTGIRIRPWEFFNYYGFGYPAAEPGLVTVTPNLAPGTGGADEFTLQIGVATQALADQQRPPLHLTLALDNSNSMEGKAEVMLRATGAAIAASLRAGDTLSIVTWNAKSAPVLELHAISGPGDPVVLDKLDELELGGSAELYAGLTAAYKLAEAAYDPNHWNRVVLVSDGGATANDTDLAVISEHVEHSPFDMKLGLTPGIYLAGVGVGDAGAYRSDLMDACARAGRGPSLFIGTEAEADRRFGKQLATTLGAAVRALEVHLELPPGFEVVHDLADDTTNDLDPGPDGLHLGPNASLVLHRTLRHCAKADPEAKLLVRVSFIDEATAEQREVKSAVKLATLLAETSPALAKGIAVQTYAQALQRWQTAPADLAPALDAALAALKAAQDLAPNDPELAEIAAVLAVLAQG